MKTIVLDAGHGGADSGATYNGRLEKNDTLRMVLAIKPHLERSNAKVILTRSNDSTVSLSDRSNLEKSVNADLFISIHRNANAPESAKGVETFSYTDGGTGRVLSMNIQSELVAIGITSNRGCKTANFHVLRETNSPAALTELGFIDHSADNEWFDSKFNQIAIAIAKGILKTAGLSFVQESSSQTKPEQPKPTVMYRVILDGTQVEALSYQSKAEEAVRAAVDSGRAKSGKVQRNTDGVDLFIYPSVQTSIDYEKELCRILVNEKNIIALTGKTKCISWAKDNYEGHIKIQCVKDNVFVAEFDNVLKKPEPPVEPPKPPVVPEKPKEPEVNKTPIVGTTVLTKGRMLKYLLDNNKEPKLTVSAEELVSYFLEEGAAEGIRGDIAFCQAIKETGFFKYGGQVLPEQNNYAGIGATNNSPVGKGAWFKNAREGVRAQIQHLKAYASTEPLKNECVDPRFNLVSRGVAPAWEDLNGRWAVPGDGYGQDILKIFERIKAIVSEEEHKPHPEPIEPEEPKDQEKESLIKTVLKLLIDLLKKLLNK